MNNLGLDKADKDKRKKSTKKIGSIKIIYYLFFKLNL